MKRFYSISALTMAVLGGLAALGVIGCYCDRCGKAGDGEGGVAHGRAARPPVAMPAPLGTYVNRLNLTQANKAEAADFVFYPDEWYMNGTQLGPYGKYHLKEVIKRLATVPFPVVIQPISEVPTNDARRQLIVAALAAAGVPDPEPRVIIAYSDAEGLRGEDAELTYYQLLYSRLYQGNYGRGFFRSGIGGFGAGFFGRGNLMGGFGFGGAGGFGAYSSGFGGLYGYGF